MSVDKVQARSDTEVDCQGADRFDAVGPDRICCTEREERWPEKLRERTHNKLTTTSHQPSSSNKTPSSLRPIKQYPKSSSPTNVSSSLTNFQNQSFLLFLLFALDCSMYSWVTFASFSASFFSASVRVSNLRIISLPASANFLDHSKIPGFSVLHSLVIFPRSSV